MDSGFMNAYHDDPYDPNYGRYESNVTEIWSTDNIIMDNMELTNNLNGILPIAATEAGNENYCNIFFPDEHIFGNSQIKNENVTPYNNFELEHFKTEEEGIIKTNNTVENNSIDLLNLIDDDVQSQRSLASFRTRTDSSSIGDYESHTSDYDDTDDENQLFYNGIEYDDVDDGGDDDGDSDESDNIAIEDLEADDLLTDLPGLNLLNGEQFMFIENGTKKRTFSTNTIDSDVDAANFDLAEFITKDDDLIPQTINATTEITTLEKIATINEEIVKVKADIDYDSDVIVDVETVEFEDIKNGESLLKNTFTEIPDDNLTFVDNVKADPEWSPNEVKLNASKHTLPSTSSNKINNAAQCVNVHCKNNKLTPKKQVLKSTQANAQQTPRQRGIGKGGKNLALLKRDRESIEEQEKETKTQTKGKDIAQIKHDSNSIDVKTENSINKCNTNNNNNRNNNKNTSNNNNSNSTQKINAETEKRKLNIEEYKRRYGEDFNIANRAKTQQQNKTITNGMKPKSTTITTKTQTTVTTLKTAANVTATTVKPKLSNQSPTKINKLHSEAVTSVVKTLKEQQIQQIKTKTNEKIDPITLAKNKVLRMQELKRAQQMKIIDSTISAKVPRVTKLLPLQEIIKDTAYAIKTDKDKQFNSEIELNKKQTEYEKIVMVSVGCNTALTFSPKDILPNVPLLQNKIHSTAQISHNSLITSIQDAVVKQSLPKPSVGKNITTSKEACTLETQQQQQQQQHGEDKIIMHLRKDRIREQNKRCIEVQTDFQPAFPILPMPKFLRNLKISRRRYRNHKTTEISSVNSCMDSSQSDIDDIVENAGSRKSVTTDNLSSRSTVAVDSISNVDYQNSEINGCGTSSIGGYSSRSSRRHRSSVSSSYSESGTQQRSRDRKRRTSYRKSMRKERHDSSSSSSSSLSDYSDRSRSRRRSSHSRNRNRTRSRSPLYEDSNLRRETNYNDRNVSKPAVEERRIVYVGRIEEETTKEMLRRKFITYGSIRQITIHYKENGMKYGFVTFERSEDAFAVIDNSTRDSQINMYDISFGGRRAFCRTSYADLDNAGINNYQSYVFPKVAAAPKQEESFEALLQKVKAKLGANKSTPNQENNKL